MNTKGPFNCYALRGGGGSIKMRTYANRGREGVTSMRTFAYNFFFIEHLLHKLLTLVTRFPVLLKISVLKKLYLFVPKITNQLRLLRTINLN